VANNATEALNAWGDPLEDRLQDVPVCAGEIALHSVCHRATFALMMAQVNSGQELRWHQPSFVSGGDHHRLVEDFSGHADPDECFFSRRNCEQDLPRPIVYT
jgi:hypothetical protein